MINDYNLDLLPLLVSLSILTFVVLWVAIRNYKNFLIIFVVIPIAITCSITSYFTVSRILGYPVHESITEESIYLSHLESPDGENIFVWIIKPGEGEPKAIIIENTKNNRMQLDQAQQATEGGNPQVIAPKNEGNGQTNGGEYVVYDFQPSGEYDALKDATAEESNTVRPGRAVAEPTGNRPRLEYQGPNIESWQLYEFENMKSIE